MAGRVPKSARREWLIATTAVLLALPSPAYFEELKMEHRESGMGSCSPEETRHCTILAEPLLRDPDLVFPDNMADIERVCRTWRQLVGCVGSYTGRCFSQDRREAFQKGAGGALASVNALCTQSLYQKEYLGHAPCIKATLTLKDHCGMYYERMVANTEVSPHSSDKASMCCAHHMFRECVVREAKQNCDLPDDELKRLTTSKGHRWTKDTGRPVADESRTASQFAQQVLDQALSFIMDQCRQYILNSNDCLEHRGMTEHDAAKMNITTEPLQPPTAPSVSSGAPPGTTKSSDEYDSWPQDREGQNYADKGTEGKGLDPGRDDVVKVVSGPKFTTVREKSVGRSRSEMGVGRSLGPRAFSEGTSDPSAWSSASWGDEGRKTGEMTTIRSATPSRKQQTTTEPWYPSYYYGNTLEGANQQGLSSGVSISITSNALIPIAICLMSLSYVSINA
ncbi:uncharacterized protein [Hetaerina americana]|uniref:uncharacterized protein n=1 Tax=Hetaerina americana TaxID=62018 RepID=UPI003A7F3157